MTEAIGEEDYLKWVIYYHERQEAMVRRVLCVAALCLLDGVDTATLLHLST